jgi:hypothetical protein
MDQLVIFHLRELSLSPKGKKTNIVGLIVEKILMSKIRIYNLIYISFKAIAFGDWRHMLFFFRKMVILTTLIFLWNNGVEAAQIKLAKHNPSKYVRTDVWRQVEKYLIPDDHPIKKKLDRIFSSSRVLQNMETMEAADFICLPPQHQTQMIVAKHPELPGYVLKLYLDKQKYYRGKPEYHHWLVRIKGARLIRKYLQRSQYGALFKVPKKWLYLLPDEPSPPAHYLRKKFILVAEDMRLYDEKTNEALWGDERVTEDFLKALYKITTTLGLRDSAKPSNCQFSIDGKAAFIDTEVYNRSDGVRYRKLTPFLSESMKVFWYKITHP